MRATEERRFHVVVLPGDGVGPEVIRCARDVLLEAARIGGVELDMEERLLGGRATDEEGQAISDETVERCRSSDAVLVGAAGGPQWDHLRDQRRPGAGLLRLRRELGLFANLRPVSVHAALADRSSLRREVTEGVDLVFVRELTGGLYFGDKGREGSGDGERAHDTMRYTRAEIERIARVGFELARSRRGRLTSVDKANVLVTSRLWRDVVSEMAAGFPDVALEHQLVDSCAMRLLRSPRDFDVVVTENTFGDILSDEAGMLVGSLGMLPSASLGGEDGRNAGDGTLGLYEPIHGSAPDIAGRDVANPLGAILSVALLLEHSLALLDAARAVREAVNVVIEGGTVTPDLGGEATTHEVGAAVLDVLTATALTGAGA
ncbi:MAG TPA: 3-isopropylmalate dehydrogenase [Candidatus Sulfotelmatobacter sp.]|nr:3-isopropylmalate dehydrogenase [Candidatus Sulfotelmatobacter sp.]